jgi:hypothetical protein
LAVYGVRISERGSEGAFDCERVALRIILTIVPDARRGVLGAMIESHVSSGGLGTMFVTTFLLRSTVVQAVLDDDSGYPFFFVSN